MSRGFGAPAPPAAGQTKKLPISSFPPEAREALSKCWDVDGSGFVTVDELVAGHNGGESARNARLRRGEALQTLRKQRGGPASSPKGDVPRNPGMDKCWGQLPGDLACMANEGTAEGAPIWERMAAVIRRRRYDMRMLMDAHDRKNKGFVDLDVFRRSLCYAFGNEWINLGMTAKEFDEITAPYLSRKPNLVGEPEPYVFWQKFAADLQAFADTRAHTDNFMARLSAIEARERVAKMLQDEYNVTEYELKTAFQAIKDRVNSHASSSSHALTSAFRRMDTDHTGYVSAAEVIAFFRDARRGDIVNKKTMSCILDLVDADGDDQINYNELSKMILCDDIIELLSLVPDKTLKSSKVKEDERIIGRGVTAAQLKHAQKTIKERLLMKHKSVQHALRDIDEDGSGTLERDEVRKMLVDFHLLKHTDYYTGKTTGEISMVAVDTLMDYVDEDGDGKVSCPEFTKVLTADNILQLPPPKPAKMHKVKSILDLD